MQSPLSLWHAMRRRIEINAHDPIEDTGLALT